MKRLPQKFSLLSLLLLLPLWDSAKATPAAPGAPAPGTSKPADSLAKVITETKAFLARYPPLPAIATRIGNSTGGTTEATPTWGRTRNHPDGAPYRLAIPANADRIGLETMPSGEVLIRVHTYWSEGGWQNVYLRQTGEVVGGLNDVPFPRTDVKNRTSQNAWQFATGLWIDIDAENIHRIGATTNEYRAGVPFRVLKPGKDSGVPGYSWTSGPEGLVIKTPKATLYGLVPFETAVFDPANGNLAFTQYDSFEMNWSLKGNGKELKSFAPSFDFTMYPTDPRRTPANQTHPGPIGAFRRNGELYVVSGENEIMIHRWEAKTRKLIPAAAVYVRPDQLPPALPGKPTFTWGQGAKALWDKAGKFTGWQVIPANVPAPLWNGYIYDVDPNDPSGVVLFTPRWSDANGQKDFIAWPIFGEGADASVHLGALNPANLKTLVIPDTLRTAVQCELTRIDWETGDLVAVVNRGINAAGVQRGWVLERYPAWYKAVDKRGLKAAYSTGPVALGVRRQYPWWATYNKELGVSPDPAAGAPSAGFGSMRTLGGYVFIAEAQAGGVRIHRLSDGAIVGRISDRLHQNSSFDNPTQIQVIQSATEFRVALLDFHGNSVLVWRVLKKDLAAGISKAKSAPAVTR